MKPEKTGAFIAQLRRECKLTQKELADRIGVTDKAVSKWERGRGFPDISILEILARELEVSIAELINGERSTTANLCECSDSAIIELLLYVKRMSRKTVGVLLVIIGACLLYAPMIASGISTQVFIAILILGIITVSGGTFMIASKKELKFFGLPKTALELISLGALAAAVIMELMPNGVILWWATPSGEPPKYSFYSYFDLLPFGNANFAPLITAVLTVAMIIFSTIVMTVGRKSSSPKNALFICLIITTAISTGEVLCGFKYVTVTGIVITLLLGISAIFRAAANSQKQAYTR